MKYTVDEDGLVKGVFDSIALMEDATIAAFLRAMGVDATFQRRPRIELWPTYERRSPDVVIADGRRWHVAFEAKLGAPLTKQQLIDEYREGSARNREFWLVTVTADNRRPRAIPEAEKELRAAGSLFKPIAWRSWTDIHRWLGSVSASDGVEGRVATRAKALLEEQGFGSFGGFHDTDRKAFAAARTAERRLRADLESFYASLTHEVRNLYLPTAQSNEWERDGARRLIGAPLVPSWVGRTYRRPNDPVPIAVRYIIASGSLWVGGGYRLDSATTARVKADLQGILDDVRRLDGAQVHLPPRSLETVGDDLVPARDLAIDTFGVAVADAALVEVILVVPRSTLAKAGAVVATRAAMVRWEKWARSARAYRAAEHPMQGTEHAVNAEPERDPDVAEAHAIVTRIAEMGGSIPSSRRPARRGRAAPT